MIKLSPVTEKFILHWGEMGTRWGINRTVAQIHALLFLSPEPLPADEIAETLSVARSNVSMSLRELQNWGIVRVVHVLGDRRDHFESMKNVWEMFRVVLAERKKREMDPTLAILRECVQEAGRNSSDHESLARIAELTDFFESITSLYDQVQEWPTSRLIRLVKMGNKLSKLLEATPSRS